MPDRKPIRRTHLSAGEARAIALAFFIEDPCSDAQVQLATAVLALIADRDDTECLALTAEMHALAMKFPRFRPKPVMSTSG